MLSETVLGGSIGTVCHDDDDEALATGIRTMFRQIDMSASNAFAEYRYRHSWAANARITQLAYRRAIDERTASASYYLSSQH